MNTHTHQIKHPHLLPLFFETDRLQNAAPKSGCPASPSEPGRLLGLAGRMRAGASTATAAAAVAAGATERPAFNLPGGAGGAAEGINAGGGALGAPKKKGVRGFRRGRRVLVICTFVLLVPPQPC